MELAKSHIGKQEPCIMCGEAIKFYPVLQEWYHVKGRKIWCEGKASVATPEY